MDFIFWDGWFRLGIVDRHWGGGSGTDMGDVYIMGVQVESFGTDIGDFRGLGLTGSRGVDIVDQAWGKG